MVARRQVSLIYLQGGGFRVRGAAPVRLVRSEGWHLHHLVQLDKFGAFSLLLLYLLLVLVLLHLLLRVGSSDLCRLDVSTAEHSKFAHSIIGEGCS